MLYAYRELMENNTFYPDGWTHCKYYPKRLQQPDRNVRPRLDPNDPVNMEIANGTPGSA